MLGSVYHDWYSLSWLRRWLFSARYSFWTSRRIMLGFLASQFFDQRNTQLD